MKYSTRNYGRLSYPIRDGKVLIGSDAHYWPGPKSTAHRAFVKVSKDLKPRLIIMNGDVIDAATISRHPPIGWENFPTVKEEIDVARDRLYEIRDASPSSDTIWTLGNHDARFETRLATVAKEYAGIKGVHLKDHFAEWKPSWSVEVGGKHGAIVKHRFKGGVNAAANNALWSGRTIITGHLHRLAVRAVSDYNGTRYGVESGMLNEVNALAFKGYTEDGSLDWQSGFVILTFHKGLLLPPELVHVIAPGKVVFRDKVITV